MSTSLIKEHIVNFLKADTFETLVIKGKIGVGKTYTWKAIFNEQKSKKAIPEKFSTYAYVSLYGVNSVSAFKLALISNSEALCNTPKKFFAPVTRFGAAVVSKFKSNIPWINITLPPDIFDVLIGNMIICVDDFERKGNELNIRELLGFLCFLKENKNCKIIVLLNEGSLDDADKSDLYEFLEKTTDRSLKFDPTPNESQEIIFQGDHPTYEQLKSYCGKLEINNMRTLSKIRFLAVALYDLFQKHNYKSDEIFNRILSIVVFANYLLYSNENGKEKLEFFRKVGTKSPNYVAVEDKKIAEEIWTVVESYGCRYVVETDSVAINAVESGFFNTIDIGNLINAQDEYDKKQAALLALENAWRPFHNSFDDNSADIVQEWENAVKKHGAYINLEQIDSMVTHARIIGQNDVADSLIEQYLSIRGRDHKMLAQKDYADKYGVRDKKFIQKLDELLEAYIQSMSLRDILLKAHKDQMLDVLSTEFLSKVTEEQLDELFRKENSHELSTLIKTGRLYIPELTKKVLAKIKTDSKLNEVRVSLYM